MPRKKRQFRKPAQADPIYDSELLNHFINKILKKGKKVKAQGIVYGAIKLIDEKGAKPGTLKVTGDLDLHGVKRPVVLDVTVNKVAAHPMSKAQSAGFDQRRGACHLHARFGQLVVFLLRECARSDQGTTHGPLRSYMGQCPSCDDDAGRNRAW